MLHRKGKEEGRALTAVVNKKNHYGKCYKDGGANWQGKGPGMY